MLAAAAIPLAVASVAFACARLTTLYLNKSAARSGAEVSGFGRNYTTDPRASDVTVRFNSRHGLVLWQGRPDQNGNITPSFRVPKAKRGYYTILATQYGADGRPAAGTPGRASLRIGQGRRTSQAVAAGWPPSGSAGPGGSGGPPGAVVTSAPAILLSVLLSGGLLGGGLVLVRAGHRRERAAPAA